MCTVLLRFTPDSRWPLLLAAIRDEIVQRPWDPPGPHWPQFPAVHGGRDRRAGGTWMAVDPARPAVAALLNGVQRGEPADGSPRPTRGLLALAALRSDSTHPVPGIPDAGALAAYDGFHLLYADRETARVWSWDGTGLTVTDLAPGDHIVVNLGIDRAEDPLVPHFAPLLAALDVPPLAPGADPAAAWGGWIELLRGDGLDPADPRGLIIEHVHGELRYGSTSASLVALGAAGEVRYDFTGTPRDPDWHEIPLPPMSH